MSKAISPIKAILEIQEARDLLWDICRGNPDAGDYPLTATKQP